MKKVLRGLFRGILILIVSLLVGGSLYSWNARRVTGNAMPMPFGYGLSVVMSGSMEPTLSVNDLVLIRATDSYDVNDIVVYQSGSSLVIHRLIEIGEDELVTRGDANNAADEPITADQVKGVYVLAVPYVGAITRILRSPAGIAVILALVVFLFYRSRKQEKLEADEELEALRRELEERLENEKHNADQ